MSEYREIAREYQRSVYAAGTALQVLEETDPRDPEAIAVAKKSYQDAKKARIAAAERLYAFQRSYSADSVCE